MDRFHVQVSTIHSTLNSKWINRYGLDTRTHLLNANVKKYPFEIPNKCRAIHGENKTDKHDGCDAHIDTQSNGIYVCLCILKQNFHFDFQRNQINPVLFPFFSVSVVSRDWITKMPKRFSFVF